MTRLGRRLALLGSLLVLAGGTGSSPASAQGGCTPQFINSGSTFSSQLCGMPDYDQRRTAAVLQGDGRTFNQNSLQIGPATFSLALQGDGGCHCVPTSFTNLLGYYVHKGVVGSFPRAFDWENRAGYTARPEVPANQYLNGQAFTTAEVSAYNAATIAIKTLGKDVVATDDKCGTSWETVLGYHKQFKPLFPKVSLATFTLKAKSSLSPKIVANLLAMGATVGVSYGRVKNWRESVGGGSFYWEGAGGGHAVTLRGISSTGNGQATITISDPARNTDPVEDGDTDRFRQSIPAAQTATLYRHVHQIDATTSETRWRWGDVSEDAKTRIWSSILVALPVSAVVADGNTVKWFPGFDFNRTGVPAEFRPKTLNVGAAVIDAALLPATGEIAYIRRGDASVRAIGVGTGEGRVLGSAPDGAVALEPDPSGGRLFVGGRSKIVGMDPTNAQPGVISSIDVAQPVRALAFDRGSGVGTGNLVAITADRGLHRLAPEGLARIGRARTLPRALFEGSGPVSAAVDPNGQLFLRRGSAGRIGRVGLANRKVGRRGISSLRGNGGLQIGDRGSLWSIVDGRLVELTPSGKALTDTALAGRRVRGRLLQIVRSGSEFSAGEAKQLIDQRVDDPFFPEMAR